MIRTAQRPAPDPRVLYCARSGAAVSNDAIWHYARQGARRVIVNMLDERLERKPDQPTVMDDHGNLVVVQP